MYSHEQMPYMLAASTVQNTQETGLPAQPSVFCCRLFSFLNFNSSRVIQAREVSAHLSSRLNLGSRDPLPHRSPPPPPRKPRAGSYFEPSDMNVPRETKQQP